MCEKKSVIKYRIMAVATKYLLRRRLNEVSLTDIARDLKVDRSVIRTYFDTIEELHDCVINTFISGVSDLLSTLVDGLFLPAVETGKIEIRKDRLHFENAQCAVVFCSKIIEYLEALFDFVLVHEDEYRLLMQEQLCGGRHQDALQRLMMLFLPTADSSMYKNASLITNSLSLSGNTQAWFLKTNIVPILDYALYRPVAEKLDSFDEEQHKRSILEAIRANNQKHVIGQDIFFIQP